MFEITVYGSHLLRKCIGPIPEMATGRKIFDFLPCRGIMAEIEYPGIAKLVSRLVWKRVAPLSSWKMLCPQFLDTPAIQALPPQAEVVKKSP